MRISTHTRWENHRKYQEWPRQTKPKKGRFMNFSQGHSGTKVQCESCLFSQGKAPEFTKMGGTHELFVLALSLVWFAGVTPDKRALTHVINRHHFGFMANFLPLIDVNARDPQSFPAKEGPGSLTPNPVRVTQRIL